MLFIISSSVLHAQDFARYEIRFGVGFSSASITDESGNLLWKNIIVKFLNNLSFNIGANILLQL